MGVSHVSSGSLVPRFPSEPPAVPPHHNTLQGPGADHRGTGVRVHPCRGRSPGGIISKCQSARRLQTPARLRDAGQGATPGTRRSSDMTCRMFDGVGDAVEWEHEGLNRGTGPCVFDGELKSSKSGTGGRSSRCEK